LASENSVGFSGLTLAGPYGFGFAKNPNPIGPDSFRSLIVIILLKYSRTRVTENPVSLSFDEITYEKID
jgi:hypothetical protein